MAKETNRAHPDRSTCHQKLPYFARKWTKSEKFVLQKMLLPFHLRKTRHIFENWSKMVGDGQERSKIVKSG
jgi:hypothetical protein